MIKLLLVEDDHTLGQTLAEKLKKEGYDIVWADTFKKAKAHILSSYFDLVIFDVGLPDGTGFDGARALQARGNTPFLFVTAQSDAQTRLEAFEIGAEEVVPKPFHLKELLLRIEHVIENHRPIQQIKFDGFTVEFETESIHFKFGEAEKLSHRDFSILRFLIERSPSIVSRDDILNQFWEEGDFPSNRTIDNSIVRIRQKLKQFSDHLVSVRSVGYQWTEKHKGTKNG